MASQTLKIYESQSYIKMVVKTKIIVILLQYANNINNKIILDIFKKKISIIIEDIQHIINV